MTLWVVWFAFALRLWTWCGFIVLCVWFDCCLEFWFTVRAAVAILGGLCGAVLVSFGGFWV